MRQSEKLYPKFTTQEPGSQYSKEHLSRANETPTGCHMWFSDQRTTISSTVREKAIGDAPDTGAPSISRDVDGKTIGDSDDPSVSWGPRPVLDYCTGIHSEEEPGQGWAILLEVFVNVVDLVGHLATGNFSGAFHDVWEFVKEPIQNQFPELARAGGLITALSEMFKKAQEGGLDVKFELNLKSMEDLVKQETFEDKDFGF